MFVIRTIQALSGRIFKFKRDPEPSGVLRALAAGTQIVGITAEMFVTQLWGVAIFCMILLVVGHWFAHRATVRGVRPRWIRVAAFVLFHLAFLYLFVGLFTGARYPQAQFAMLATAIVTVEIASRMNLNAAIGLGLANLYVAATLSRGTEFLLFLVAYVGLWLAYLWVADGLDGQRNNPQVLRLEPTNPARVPQVRAGLWAWNARFVVAAAVVAPLVFIVTPHYAGRPLFMPVTFNLPIRQQPSVSVINPAVPLIQIRGQVNRDESEYYFGFADQVDLSYRGGLSRKVMMLVKSPAWSYWRGYALDTYDGVNWSQADPELDNLRGDLFNPTRFVIDRNATYEEGFFVQSFYIMAPMPNVVWTGGVPFELYLAASEIGVDSSDGYRVGAPLQPNQTYSVISNRVDFSPEQLRASSGSFFRPMYRQYTQLPDTVTERTRELARTITADAPTQYDKVIAVRDHLLTTYPYDFFPPPQPVDIDAVDNFLFTDQRGVCEHYVSAMVVMLRTLNIPSRFVVGYGSGDYNALSGYYTVRANDAHAWVEVYFPDYGWVPFDPTPGWNGDPQSGPVDTWIFSDFFESRPLPSLPVEQIAAGTSLVLGVLAQVAVPLLGIGAAWLVLAFIWRVAWRWWRAYQGRFHRDPARLRVLRAYRWALFWRRLRRQPAQTVREHAAQHPELAALVDSVEVAAYRNRPPTQQDDPRTSN
ncbi:MAG: transglutaminaseTgpA domain-containing protein [Phototrophicaceae bacterium]|jgi:transglutaminase-like putative cysteine protease